MACSFVRLEEKENGRRGSLGRCRVDGRCCSGVLRLKACQIDTTVPFPEIGSLIGGLPLR